MIAFGAWDLAAIAAGHWTYDPAQTLAVTPARAAADRGAAVLHRRTRVHDLADSRRSAACSGRRPATKSRRRRDLHVPRPCWASAVALAARSRGAADPPGHPGGVLVDVPADLDLPADRERRADRRGVVRYAPDAIIGSRIAYAPVEDLAFGFALVLVTLSVWVWLGRRGLDRTPVRGRTVTAAPTAVTLGALLIAASIVVVVLLAVFGLSRCASTRSDRARRRSARGVGDAQLRPADDRGGRRCRPRPGRCSALIDKGGPYPLHAGQHGLQQLRGPAAEAAARLLPRVHGGRRPAPPTAASGG